MLCFLLKLIAIFEFGSNSGFFHPVHTSFSYSAVKYKTRNYQEFSALFSATVLCPLAISLTDSCDKSYICSWLSLLCIQLCCGLFSSCRCSPAAFKRGQGEPSLNLKVPAPLVKRDIQWLDTNHLVAIYLGVWTSNEIYIETKLLFYCCTFNLFFIFVFVFLLT